MYAFITGASSGIGKEFALQLAKRGYDLILVARREERLKQLEKQIKETWNRKVLIETCDLSMPKHCFKLFQKYKKYPIFVVINNAGFGKVGSFTNLPLKEDLSMIRTNITAVHILTKLFASHLKSGYILNVASIAGFQPGPMLATYSASKSYVLNLSLAINYEMKKLGKKVHISTLCPGPVNTEFNKVAGTHMALSSISAGYCAKIGLKGMFGKKKLIIPSTQMKLLHLLSKFSPYCMSIPIEYKIQTKKI